jgi:hypothetical protein
MGEKNNNKDYYRRVLSSVLSFLRDGGMPASDVRSIVEGILAAQERGKSKTDAARKALGGDVDTIYAVVLHRWHREKLLLGEGARPRPIRLLGKFPSVEALVAAEKPEASARTIALSLESVGLVVKQARGKYVPKSRIATVSALHPMLVEHVSKSLVRYLDTVSKNTAKKRNLPTLIERYTHVPDLEKTAVPEFRAFAQSHGSAFLASVDDWLEGRRAKRTGNVKATRKGVSAGIHVFAYVDEPVASRSTTRRAKRA